MKHTSKWAYLLGLPVLVGLSILSTINVVNGDVSIRIPTPGDLHRSQLFSLSLGKRETDANVKVDVDNNRLNVYNGIIMGENNGVANSVNYASIGGGKGNYIAASVEKSGIGGGNGNAIGSSFSVIGGGSGNSINGGNSQANAIAGGASNITQAGGTVVGGLGNNAKGTGVILGGQNNSFDGDGSMILGSDSQGGKGSFSWNSSISQNYSAIIMATGGALIGTYETVSGVNLVVDGAVKLGNNSIEGMAGEIRLQSGCFYGYDGSDWHVINRGLGNECFDNEITCKFGSVVLQPHETVMAYSEPYAETCVLEVLECNENGILGEAGNLYYPYCHAWGGASCGTANGQQYSDLPTEGLCSSGIAVGLYEQDNTYTWLCVNGDKSASCSATKVSGCQGNGPTGAGVKKGSANGSTSWSYVNQQPGVCQWTCEAGYTRVSGENRCTENNGASVAAKCGSAAGGTYVTFPEEGLCDVGVVYVPQEGDNLHTWQCKNGDNYVSCSAIRDRTSFSCVSTDRMLKDVDAVVQISGPSPDEDVQKQLFASSADVPEGQYCAYICNEEGGWHYFPEGVRNGQTVQKRCAKCVQGSEIKDSNGNIISCIELIDVCPHNYYYKLETNQCIAYGNCLWNGSIRHSLEHTVNILDSERLKLARPIGMNMEWTWKTSLDDVEYNKCNFVCEPGYISRRYDDYKYGCVKPFCSNIGRIKNHSLSVENPMSYNHINKVSGGRTYEKYWEYVEDITGEDAFYEWVANKNGCYYWCPEDRLCRRNAASLTHELTNDSSKWTCYASAEEKEVGCVDKVYDYDDEGSSCKVCNGYNPYLKGYTTQTNCAYGENRNFKIYTTPGEYQSHTSEGCYQGCTNDATDAITGPDGETICWKQCPDYQYFNIDGGGCTSCPNNMQKPDPNNMFNGNSLGPCINKCGADQILCQDCGTNGGEACIEPIINLNIECETGGVQHYNEMLDRWECVYDVYVYEEDGD